jgi:hypothetical protein
LLVPFSQHGAGLTIPDWQGAFVILSPMGRKKLLEEL